MSGFVSIGQGPIHLKHYSAASVIKLIITQQVPKNQQGDVEDVVTEVIMNYSEFSDLKKAVNKTDEWL